MSLLAAYKKDLRRQLTAILHSADPEGNPCWNRDKDFTLRLKKQNSSDMFISVRTELQKQEGMKQRSRLYTEYHKMHRYGYWEGAIK